MPLILAACPSFADLSEAEVRDQNLDEEVDGGRLGYLDAGDFIRHLVALKLACQTDEFPCVFAVIERLITEGDNDASNLGVVGYIEGLQMASVISAGLDPERDSRPYLRPTSDAYWEAINRFWADGTPIPTLPPVR